MRDFKVYQTSGMLNFLVHEASDVRNKEQTLSGDIVSFTADEQAPVKIVVNIDSTGWAGCEVTRTGANLCGGQKFAEAFSTCNGYTIDTTDKKFTFSRSSSGILPFGVKFKDRAQYTVICKYSSAGQNTSLQCYYSDGTKESVVFPNSNSVISTVVFKSQENKTVKEFRVNWVVTSTITCYYEESGIFEGVLTASDFEPYQGTTASVTFPDEVGAITDGTLAIDYDGSVTLETGGQTYPLTSVSPIETLIGDNNIWADAGPVSVTYPI